MARPITERFWTKVQRGATADCWPWTGSTDGRGYGQMSAGGRGLSPKKAYRVAWEIHHGPIPGGLVVRHKCDNGLCVNPAHLELGTQRENARDTSARGRLSRTSLLNLRPGAPGFHGAGPLSRKELHRG